MGDIEPAALPSDNLFDWAALQFTVSHLLEQGKITEGEAFWYKHGWLPATHGDGR